MIEMRIKREDFLHYKDKKLVRKSDTYKHVSLFTAKGFIYYKAQISSLQFAAWFLDEKEAAKAVDLRLIKEGKKPVNVLKKIDK